MVQKTEPVNYLLVHKMDIAGRLKQERERLGLTQTAFGQIGGAGKTTVIAWERGDAYPNAAFLAAVAAAGVDINYVVTGQRDYEPPPPMSRDEMELLVLYRAASLPVRAAAVAALASGQPGSAKYSVDFGQAKIGQVISNEGGTLKQRDVVVGKRKANKK